LTSRMMYYSESNCDEIASLLNRAWSNPEMWKALLATA